MEPAERSRNPFTTSGAGGRALSAMQLPFFLAHPPAGYGVLTTVGRVSGKPRRRCVRAIRDGDRAYVVAIKGARTGWVKNALRGPDVELRIGGRRFAGRARRPDGADERERARLAYCETVHAFDYLTWINWRRGRPTADRIRELLRSWFEKGIPVVV